VLKQTSAQTFYAPHPYTNVVNEQIYTDKMCFMVY